MSFSLKEDFIIIIRSPEPKGHRWAYSIVKAGIRRPSIVGRPSSSSTTFSNDISSEAKKSIISHISHIASTGRGNKLYCFFLSKSDKNTGCYGNL